MAGEMAVEGCGGVFTCASVEEEDCGDGRELRRLRPQTLGNNDVSVTLELFATIACDGLLDGCCSCPILFLYWSLLRALRLCLLASTAAAVHVE